MFEKPNVVILGKLPPPYFGPAIATKIILASSLNNYFTLFHLCTNINEQVEQFESFHPGKIIRSVQLYFQLMHLIRTYKPHLILVPISQSTMGFFKDSIFIFVAKLFSIKTIIHLRGSNFSNWVKNSSALNRMFVRYVLCKTDSVIVLGEKLRNLFSDYFPPSRIFVVPNGADFTILPKLHNNSKQTRLLFLSNLQPSKGVEDVLESIRILHKKNVNIHANIVGGWRDQETKSFCEAIVEKNNLHVVFSPPVGAEEKFKYYLDADIFIFPPRKPEGHPWVIIEAMAAGLPIIATDQGAIRESVINDVNGYIVEPNNPQQIAEKIEILAQNPEIRMRMGEESRRLYLEKFTEDKMVENLVRAFKATMDYTN